LHARISVLFSIAKIEEISLAFQAESWILVLTCFCSESLVFIGFKLVL